MDHSEKSTVKLAHIAADSGCSVATVSLVLNPQPGKNPRISEKTRQRITASAARLGYRPNRHAEFLKRGSLSELGIFLPEFDNSLILDFIKGSCVSANEEDFSLSYCFYQDENSLKNFLEQAICRRNCGLIIYPSVTMENAGEFLKKYCRQGGKAVLIEPQGPELLHPLPELPRILLDDRTGGQLVADHLLEQGCRIFVIYGDGRTRVASFIEQIKKYDCRFTHHSTHTPVEKVVEDIHSSSGKVGVFCSTDSVALSLHTALLSAGTIPGEQIKLCGYDCLFRPNRLTPQLTSVYQPFKEAGYQAVKMLIRSIYDRPVENLLLQPELRPCASTLGNSIPAETSPLLT